MQHAAQLDLIAYEDPVFYDRLERARVQATDRLGMIQSIGRLVQQVITTISLSVSIMLFSPWLLLLLIIGVVPAFLGESHFAFLGYAKNFRQTPIRRQLDYLRVLGGSKEAAKELKLFGLRQFLVDRFSRLSDQIYKEDVSSGSPPPVGRLVTIGDRHRWILRRLCLRDLADRDGQAHHRQPHLPCRRHSAGQLQHPADFLYPLGNCRSGLVPHRSDCFLRNAAHHPLQAQCPPGPAARSSAASSSATCRSRIPAARA